MGGEGDGGGEQGEARERVIYRTACVAPMRAPHGHQFCITDPVWCQDVGRTAM